VGGHTTGWWCETFDVRKFRIFTVNTRVWKGYDYIILPDGRLVKVAPGKYMRVTPNSFGFEDLTEELGQKPDWDYDEPACTFTVSGVVFKTVTLRCRYTGGYENHLYYGRIKVYEFKPGSYTRDITFSYLDRGETALASIILGVVGGGLAYARTRRAGTGLAVGGGIAVAGTLAGALVGD
jgi:hypothetical protein